MQLSEVQKKLYHVNSVIAGTKKKIEETRTLVSEDEHNIKVIDLSSTILENYLSSVSKSVSGTLESLMRSALNVFNMDIDVRLEYKEGAQGGYRPVISQNGVTGGVTSFGGGVLSLISFIMLVSSVVLKEKRRLLILDETFSAVSAEYQEPLSNFISQLCKDFGFTIIVVSHQPALNTHASTSYVVSSNKKEGTIIKKMA
jgi:DNA repair exonuclease SbcCD ATPase subunit